MKIGLSRTPRKKMSTCVGGHSIYLSFRDLPARQIISMEKGTDLFIQQENGKGDRFIY